MAELAGVMVGNYFLLERLSREGMVETYLARPTVHGGYDVHLRLFRPPFPDPTSFQEHFPIEVRKVWQCRHEHIQPLVEFGAGEDLLYTATRAEEMPTLEQLLKRQGTDELSLPQVARLLTQLCEALQYAHTRKIVHGNIQPSSILVDDDGQVLLTNFALKQASRENDAAFAQVEEGNAAYIAPEQVVGMLGPASDIYALGVLLFRLLGGMLPFDAESAGEIAMLHAKEPVPDLCALRPDLPEAVGMVVKMALAKNAAARFSSAHELAVAFLKALTEDQPPPAPLFSSRRINVKARHTSLTWARAFSLLALLLILLGLGSTFSLVSFSSFPSGAFPGMPLGVAGSRSIFPALPPLLNLVKQPAPTPTPGYART
ncbi:MAG TPA: serine/threonine-protein kinase, partial [Ktedonobacteraceae bacterium]|nr:serine/threonine-protein kinase [Ktedonobacteraceae bacterium]